MGSATHGGRWGGPWGGDGSAQAKPAAGTQPGRPGRARVPSGSRHGPDGGDTARPRPWQPPFPQDGPLQSHVGTWAPLWRRRKAHPLQRASCWCPTAAKVTSWWPGGKIEPQAGTIRLPERSLGVLSDKRKPSAPNLDFELSVKTPSWRRAAMSIRRVPLLLEVRQTGRCPSEPSRCLRERAAAPRPSIPTGRDTWGPAWSPASWAALSAAARPTQCSSADLGDSPPCFPQWHASGWFHRRSCWPGG